VVTGTTASGLHIDAARAAAIAVSFLTSAALWWLYFDFVATIAQRRLATSDESGALARDAYTYIHTLMVAGIIVAAVGDAVLIRHPGGHATGAQLAALAGGPALYLAGHVAFRLRMAHSLSPKRVGATIALVLAGLLGFVMPTLACASLLLAILIALIVAELVAGRRRQRSGRPSPQEALSGDMPV
jgi:low temperature requirement protein LtrA